MTLISSSSEGYKSSSFSSVPIALLVFSAFWKWCFYRLQLHYKIEVPTFVIPVQDDDRLNGLQSNTTRQHFHWPWLIQICQLIWISMISSNFETGSKIIWFWLGDFRSKNKTDAEWQADIQDRLLLVSVANICQETSNLFFVIVCNIKVLTENNIVSNK